MDRLVWAAWRAFWVGLGASVVIVGQSLLAPATPAPSAADLAAPAVQEVAPQRQAQPVLSQKRVRLPHAS